jgi:putative flippase GtrA
LISKLTHLVRDRRQDIVRFLKFCVVGVIGTAIDFGIFNLLHNILGWDRILSNTLSVTAAIVNNYLWNLFWVYPETRGRQNTKKFIQFIIVSITAWALNTGILWSSERWVFGTNGLFAGLVGKAAGMLGAEHEVLSSNAAKVLATGIVLFWNFFVNRLWTFRDVDSAEPTTSSPEPPAAPAD